MFDWVWNALRELAQHYLVFGGSLFLVWLSHRLSTERPHRKEQEPAEETVGHEGKKPNRVRHVIAEGVPLLIVLLIYFYGKHVAMADFHKQHADQVRRRLPGEINAVWQHYLALQDDRVRQLVVLGEEIGHLSARTFDVVEDSDPQLQPRTMTLFLDKGDGEIENLIQEGEPGFGRSVFEKDVSFVGKTIENREARYRYCPDVSADSCQPIQTSAILDFKSIICYPLKIQAGAVGAICLDSVRPHAFDGKEDQIWATIHPEVASSLMPVLWEYRGHPLISKSPPPTASSDAPSPQQKRYFSR